MLDTTDRKKLNTKRYVKLLSLFLVLVSVAACVIAPAASAAAAVPADAKYSATAYGSLNIRTGPGTDYAAIGTIAAGEFFYLDGTYYNDGLRVYWRLCGAEDRWVSRGSNDNQFSLTSVKSTIYTDTISGFDIFGQLRFSHTCSQTVSVWYYHIEVRNEGYLIYCDCGWTKDVSCPTSYVIGDDGSWVEGQYGHFIGLDTDNNEFEDTFPGQKIDLKCRANTDLRPYCILEFYGSSAGSPPTVQIAIYDKYDNLLKSYTFDWWVIVKVESYGVKFTDMRGAVTTYTIPGEFLLKDFTRDLILGKAEYKYMHGKLVGEDEYWGDGRHVQYRFEVTKVNMDEMNILDWVTYLCQMIGDFIYPLMNIFNLSGVFTSSDSPFRFVAGG